MKPTLVSVVIPYHSNFDELQACLRSLAAQSWPAIEVIVLDNASGDKALYNADFQESHRVISNKKNEGFARAVNQGHASAGGDYLLVLNSDAILEPAYIESCVSALENNPSAAGATGKLLKLTDRSIIDSTGHVIFGDRRVTDRGEWEKDSGQYDAEEEVFSLSATAALYRKSALDELQQAHGEVFDEDFFMYQEDVDLAWRLRLMGWKLLYEPKAVALHRRAVSGGRRSTPSHAWDLRNRYLRMVKLDTLQSILSHADEILLTEVRLFIYFLIHRPLVPFLAWGGFLRRLPRAIRKRKLIQNSTKLTWRKLEPWFRKYDYRAALRRIG